MHTWDPRSGAVSPEQGCLCTGPLHIDIFLSFSPGVFFCLVSSSYPQDMIPGVAKGKILAPARTAGTHTMSQTCPYPCVSELS